MAEELEATWGSKYSPAVREKLAGDVRMVVEYVRDRWHPQSIILAGSFGTGEGVILQSDVGFRYLSDYEISVVRWRPISRSALKEAGETLGKQIGAEIGLYYNPPFKYRSSLFQKLFWRPGRLPVVMYDRRYASRVIYGDNVLADMPVLDAAEIPVWEGLRLIFNRIGQSLGGIGTDWKLEGASEPPAGQGAFWLYRTVLACQDALLIASGRYAASYAERTARLDVEYEHSYPELSEALPDFVRLAKDATEYRLQSPASLDVPFQDLFLQVQQASRLIVAFLLQKELNLCLGPGDTLYTDYTTHPKVVSEFYRLPSRLAQDLHNVRAVSALAGCSVSWALCRRRMLHQHLNMLIFLLYLNLWPVDKRSQSQLQTIRDVGLKLFLMDLPEIDDPAFIPRAVSSLDKLWASFRM